MAEAGKRLAVDGRTDSLHVLSIVPSMDARDGSVVSRVRFIHSNEGRSDKCPNGCPLTATVQVRGDDGKPIGDPVERELWLEDGRGWHVCQVDQATDFPGAREDAYRGIAFVADGADDATIASACGKRATAGRSDDVTLRIGEHVDLDDGRTHWLQVGAIEPDERYYGTVKSTGEKVTRIEFSELRASRDGVTPDVYDVLVDSGASRATMLAAMYRRVGLDPPDASARTSPTPADATPVATASGATVTESTR